MGTTYTIKIGEETLPKRMTEKQAMNYAKRRQSEFSKRNGFSPALYFATMDLNGWAGIRINYTRP